MSDSIYVYIEVRNLDGEVDHAAEEKISFALALFFTAGYRSK